MSSMGWLLSQKAVAEDAGKGGELKGLWWIKKPLASIRRVPVSAILGSADSLSDARQVNIYKSISAAELYPYLLALCIASVRNV